MASTIFLTTYISILGIFDIFLALSSQTNTFFNFLFLASDNIIGKILLVSFNSPDNPNSEKT